MRFKLANYEEQVQIVESGLWVIHGLGSGGNSEEEGST
jgi:hypothetical protein